MANSPFLWGCAISIFLVIILQSVIYIRAGFKEAPVVGMPRSEVHTAIRAGAISAIMGPSIAIVVVAVGLLSLFGGFAVLMRIGLIGSAGYELIAANAGSEALGIELGGEGFDGQAFATVFTVMSLGGAMWMTSALTIGPVSAAICGAALVHVISLVLLVGIGGTWLVSALPESFVGTFDYILPAVLGPVLV